MRASIWSAALVLGLCLGGTASAQSNFGVAGSATSPNLSPGMSGSSPGLGITEYLSHTFSLAKIFPSYQMIAKTLVAPSYPIPGITNYGPIASSSPTYLQAFGFQKLYNPNYRRPFVPFFGGWSGN
jgi:hypothetical protein